MGAVFFFHPLRFRPPDFVAFCVNRSVLLILVSSGGLGGGRICVPEEEGLGKGGIFIFFQGILSGSVA